eukprot:gene5445-5993_t
MLTGILPPPKNNPTKNQHLSQHEQGEDEEEVPKTTSSSGGSQSISSNRKVIPSYPNRKGFIPTKADDFQDGGAYPEIHLIQYPLNMGKPGQKSTAVIPVQLTEKGTLRTDLIVKQGVNKSKIIQTSLQDIKEKVMTKEDIALPDPEEEVATALRTKEALEAIIQSKIKTNKGGTITSKEEVEPQYIRYTANPNAPGYNAAASQRVIKMVEAQVDPMEPPKHKQMKVPRAAPAPPVPVLHSPPRKLTVADQQAWKIPPCVSNWVNARGFIIPLDKRLVADGRGLQESTINNKFAMLSESLYIAERKAVQDLNIRNELRKKIALREKEERENQLREMANRARLERSGALASSSYGTSAIADYRSDEDEEGKDYRSDDGSVSSRHSDDEDGNGDEEDPIARQQRERLRFQRRKEHEREMRLANMKGNLRRTKADRDETRDVSEQVALGLLKGTGKLTGESAFDNRLFNQSGGMDQGFGGEDDYNVYSRPLFDRGEAGSIYRPKNVDGELYGGGEGGGGGAGADDQMDKLLNTSRFRPDKGFKGAEGGGRGQGGRDAPVQFEKVDERDPYARDRESGRRRSRSEDSRDGGGGRGGGRRGRDDSASPPRRGQNKRSRHDSDED